jgi:hypothetical protein
MPLTQFGFGATQSVLLTHWMQLPTPTLHTKLDPNLTQSPLLVHWPQVSVAALQTGAVLGQSVWAAVSSPRHCTH